MLKEYEIRLETAAATARRADEGSPFPRKMTGPSAHVDAAPPFHSTVERDRPMEDASGSMTR